MRVENMRGHARWCACACVHVGVMSSGQGLHGEREREREMERDRETGRGGGGEVLCLQGSGVFLRPPAQEVGKGG